MKRFSFVSFHFWFTSSYIRTYELRIFADCFRSVVATIFIIYCRFVEFFLEIASPCLIPHFSIFILHKNRHKFKHTHISSQPVELIVIYFVLDEVIVLILKLLFVFRAFLHDNSSILALLVPFVVSVEAFVFLLSAMWNTNFFICI